MDKANLPLEKACEPTEEAHQPVCENTMPSSHKNKLGEETIASQCSSSYRDALTQPAPGLSARERLLWLQARRTPGLWVQCDSCDKWRHLPHVVDSHELPDKWFCRLNPGLSARERLLWLQARRTPGLWVQCDSCDKWRHLPHVVDSHELPDKWYCRLNPDRNEADCSVPETSIRLRHEEDMIHSEYSAGSVVWARFGGWPWWPAMVDDCPDTEQFYWLDGLSDIPTYYNVVFFDSSEVTRAWITPGNLKPYSANKKAVNKNKKYKKRLEVACSQADDADMLPLANRLTKYSFISRFRGTVGSPKILSKKEYEKFKNKLKRKLNIDFSDESDLDDNVPEKEKPVQRRQEIKNTNTIIVGTPKRKQSAKKTAKRIPTEDDQVPVAPKEILKEPDSMTVLIGSTSVNNTMTVDNDSSKTYMPGQDTAPNDTCETEPSFHVRIATPTSDDFEF